MNVGDAETVEEVLGWPRTTGVSALRKYSKATAASGHKEQCVAALPTSSLLLVRA